MTRVVIAGANTVDCSAREYERPEGSVPGHEWGDPRDLGNMNSLAEAWPEEAILQQLAAKLLWFHNLTLS